MPYVQPESYILSSNKNHKVWSLSKMTLGGSTIKACADSTAKDDRMISSHDVTSQSSTPRRKSAPELYSRKHDLPAMPCVLRKKSGEVVKPSLKKGHSTIPTFPKYVHFNTDLEQVRFFDKARAVNADVSSDDDTDDDTDDDDDDDDDDEAELCISLPNMPLVTTVHDSRPVFFESAFLSQDKKSLQGHVIVQNIAFEKIVEIKYTFDFWSSVSEVSASYVEDVSLKEDKNRFVFAIELIDNSRNPINGKVMHFAVRYNVNGHDFWDNNNGSNYQVNFKNFKRTSTSITTQSKPKKNSPAKSQNVSSNWSISSTLRPKNLDDSLCHSPPALDSRKKSSLGDHYDIAASLSAAQNASRSSLNPSNATRTFQPSYVPPAISFFLGNYIDGMPGTCVSELSSSPSQWDDDAPNRNSSPIAIPSSKPMIGSSSYYELLNQYCFHSGSPYAANSPCTISPVM